MANQYKPTRALSMPTLWPTCYFRYERRDTSCPTMVLQQLWCEYESAVALRVPEECKFVEWRDVPIVQQQVIKS